MATTSPVTFDQNEVLTTVAPSFHDVSSAPTARDDYDTYNLSATNNVFVGNVVRADASDLSSESDYDASGDLNSQMRVTRFVSASGASIVPGQEYTDNGVSITFNQAGSYQLAVSDEHLQSLGTGSEVLGYRYLLEQLNNEGTLVGFSFANLYLTLNGSGTVSGQTFFDQNEILTTVSPSFHDASSAPTARDDHDSFTVNSNSKVVTGNVIKLDATDSESEADTDATGDLNRLMQIANFTDASGASIIPGHEFTRDGVTININSAGSYQIAVDDNRLAQIGTGSEVLTYSYILEQKNYEGMTIGFSTAALYVTLNGNAVPQTQTEPGSPSATITIVPVITAASGEGGATGGDSVPTASFSPSASFAPSAAGAHDDHDQHIVTLASKNISGNVITSGLGDDVSEVDTAQTVGNSLSVVQFTDLGAVGNATIAPGEESNRDGVTLSFNTDGTYNVNVSDVYVNSLGTSSEVRAFKYRLAEKDADGNLAGTSDATLYITLKSDGITGAQQISPVAGDDHDLHNVGVNQTNLTGNVINIDNTDSASEGDRASNSQNRLSVLQFTDIDAMGAPGSVTFAPGVENTRDGLSLSFNADGTYNANVSNDLLMSLGTNSQVRSFKYRLVERDLDNNLVNTSDATLYLTISGNGTYQGETVQGAGDTNPQPPIAEPPNSDLSTVSPSTGSPSTGAPSAPEITGASGEGGATGGDSVPTASFSPSASFAPSAAGAHDDHDQHIVTLASKNISGNVITSGLGDDVSEVDTAQTVGNSLSVVQFTDLGAVGNATIAPGEESNRDGVTLSFNTDGTYNVNVSDVYVNSLGTSSEVRAFKYRLAEKDADGNLAGTSDATLYITLKSDSITETQQISPVAGDDHDLHNVGVNQTNLTGNVINIDNTDSASEGDRASNSQNRLSVLQFTDIDAMGAPGSVTFAPGVENTRDGLSLSFNADGTYNANVSNDLLMSLGTNSQVRSFKYRLVERDLDNNLVNTSDATLYLTISGNGTYQGDTGQGGGDTNPQPPIAEPPNSDLSTVSPSTGAPSPGATGATGSVDLNPPEGATGNLPSTGAPSPGATGASGSVDLNPPEGTTGNLPSTGAPSPGATGATGSVDLNPPEGATGNLPSTGAPSPGATGSVDLNPPEGTTGNLPSTGAPSPGATGASGSVDLNPPEGATGNLPSTGAPSPGATGATGSVDLNPPEGATGNRPWADDDHDQLNAGNYNVKSAIGNVIIGEEGSEDGWDTDAQGFIDPLLSVVSMRFLGAESAAVNSGNVGGPNGSTMTFNADGSYRFDMSDGYRQQLGTASAVVNYEYQVRNGEGYFSTATLYVTVIGDGGISQSNDSDSLYSTDLNKTATGNVISGVGMDSTAVDTVGGGKTLSVIGYKSIDGVEHDVGTSDAFSDYTFRINSDGQYSLIASDSLVQSLGTGSQVKSFTYYLQDSEGYTDEATLAVTIYGDQVQRPAQNRPETIAGASGAAILVTARDDHDVANSGGFVKNRAIGNVIKVDRTDSLNEGDTNTDGTTNNLFVRGINFVGATGLIADEFSGSDAFGLSFRDGSALSIDNAGNYTFTASNAYLDSLGTNTGVLAFSYEISNRSASASSSSSPPNNDATGAVPLPTADPEMRSTATLYITVKGDGNIETRNDSDSLDGDTSTSAQGNVLSGAGMDSGFATADVGSVGASGGTPTSLHIVGYKSLSAGRSAQEVDVNTVIENNDYSFRLGTNGDYTLNANESYLTNLGSATSILRFQYFVSDGTYTSQATLSVTVHGKQAESGLGIASGESTIIDGPTPPPPQTGGGLVAIGYGPAVDSQNDEAAVSVGATGASPRTLGNVLSNDYNRVGDDSNHQLQVHSIGDKVMNGGSLVVNGEYGRLVMTKSGSYIYEATGNPPNGVSTETFVYKVVNHTTGGAADATLTVTVVNQDASAAAGGVLQASDDHITIRDGFSVNTYQDGTATSVLSNDRGAEQVVGVNGVSDLSEPIQGRYGKLQMDEFGHYNYVQNDGWHAKQATVDQFTYTVKGFDDSLETKTLFITIQPENYQASATNELDMEALLNNQRAAHGRPGVDTYFSEGEHTNTFKWSQDDLANDRRVDIDVIYGFKERSLSDGSQLYVEHGSATTGMGDRLDLKDLLKVDLKRSVDGIEESEELTRYMHFEKKGDDTVIQISTSGRAQEAGIVNDDLHIVLKDVNLTQHGSETMTDQMIIQDLLNRNKLIID